MRFRAEPKPDEPDEPGKFSRWVASGLTISGSARSTNFEASNLGSLLLFWLGILSRSVTDTADDEQGFSAAITEDYANNVDVEGTNTISADQSGTRISGLEQVSGDGAPIPINQLVADLGIDTTEKSSSPPEELSASREKANVEHGPSDEGGSGGQRGSRTAP